MTLPDGVRRLWPLDTSVTFLNHGSYGACPRAVLEAQARFRERLESEPVRFLSRELEGLLDEARAALGAFLGAAPDDLAFVPNATTGVNTVLRWLDLDPGDEVLATDHAYNACRNAVDAVTARARARVVVAPVPFPLKDPEEVLEAVLGRVGPRTRLALVDHVTSPTGLVLPIDRLVGELSARGVDALVDGAHAPGMVPLDLRALGAAYYTGNCHKWMCAPKGTGFLHVRPDRQAGVRPLVISHGANSRRADRSRFRLEFDWMGTVDPTAYLTIPAAIRYVGSLLPGGWPAVMARNRAIALAARDRLSAVLSAPTPAPDSMIGSLAAVPVPMDFGPAPLVDEPDPLQTILFDRFGIELLVFTWRALATRILRVSAQLYNTAADYERLADALGTLQREKWSERRSAAMRDTAHTHASGATPGILTDDVRDSRAWRRAELSPRDWLVTLPAPCIDELDAVVRQVRHDPLPTLLLSPSDFALAACADVMRSVHAKLCSGIGLAVVDRVPVERYELEENRLVCWLLTQLVQRPVAQAWNGAVLYDVRDTGRALEYGVRRSVTNLDLTFHTDGPWLDLPPHLVGLYCINPAQEGGVSRFVSFLTVHNELRRRHPDLLPRLYRPFPWDRQAEHATGDRRTGAQPIFQWDGRSFVGRFNERLIEAGAELDGVPLDEQGQRALDAMRQVVDSPELWVEFTIERGQIQYLNNREFAHSRTDFRDASEPHLKRHLIRVWTREEGRRTFHP